MTLEADKRFAIKDDFSNDLQVSYENNCLRFIINDTMEWVDERTTTAHLEAISTRVGAYLEIAQSDQFRKDHPMTSLDKLSIALRLRHAPNATGENALRKITEKLEADGVRFFYGRGDL